jgi:hypothetical protein
VASAFFVKPRASQQLGFELARSAESRSLDISDAAMRHMTGVDPTRLNVVELLRPGQLGLLP